MSEALEVISSFYLPVTSGKLLLPNVSVAEVVDFQEPEQDEESNPDYYLGKIRWRGLLLPLLSFEVANESRFELSSNSRIAVINSVGVSNEALPFFAVVTRGIPRLVKITDDSIESTGEPVGPAQSAIVRVDGEEASIPNMEYLESLVMPFIDA